jgi:hypothetical protein
MKALTVLHKLLLGIALLTSALAVQAQNTVSGGSLFVAQPGPIDATLLGTGGTNFFFIDFWYSTCDANCSNPQRQDAFAHAFSNGQPGTFTAASSVGSKMTLQPQPGDPINGQLVSTFPQGTPIFVTMSNGDQFVSTGNNKDLGRAYSQTALVTYGPNNTATVAFPSANGGMDLTVGLTNVFNGSSTGGGGCRS